MRFPSKIRKIEQSWEIISLTADKEDGPWTSSACTPNSKRNPEHVIR